MTIFCTIARLAAAGTAVALAGCGVPRNAPLISTASPAAASSINQEPQSQNSLPPYAAGLQSSGPNNVAPNYVSTPFRGL